MRVLLVEDDPLIASGVIAGLRAHGIAVEHVEDAQSAEMAHAENTFDALVLDLGLPDRDGMDLLAVIRAVEPSLPVLILTARDAIEHRLTGFNGGADDYMVKPFELPELLARLRALLRRSQAATSATLTFGSLELDTAHRQACIRPPAQTTADDESVLPPTIPIELGPREWTVMEYLLLQAPKPANKDKLLQALTGWDKEITPNAVEVYISRLRGKLEPHGIALRSIRGFGYRLELVTDNADVAGLAAD